MNETEVDGVPVLWTDEPGPLTGTLTFGVGVRDETYRTSGITHLVEHLAMSALPRVHYEHNASVDLETTRFHATGRPEHLVSFFDTVCTALSFPPLERMGREVGVLAAEGGTVAHTTAAALASRRFGRSGPGLAYWIGPGLDRLTPQHVLDHLRRFFVRGNAVLMLTGPPPKGLALRLPEGDRPVRADPVVATEPTWAREPVDAPGIALLGPAVDATSMCVLRVLRERLVSVARHERGITYDVGGDQVLAGAGRMDRMLWLDARDGQAGAAAELLWETATTVAATGPMAQELGFEVNGLRHVLDDPRRGAAEVARAAHARLLGYPYRPATEVLAAVEAVTPGDVAAALSAALRTAQLVVPEWCELAPVLPDGTVVPEGGCGRLPRWPAGRQFRPPWLARMIGRAARHVRVILGATGVTFVDADDVAHHTEFRDVVGVQSNADGRVVFARDGCVLPILTTVFPSAAPVIQAIDREVPAHLHYPPSDLTPFPTAG